LLRFTCGGVGETTALGLLGEEGELALLGDVAELAKVLDCLAACGLLAAGDNTPASGFHEILLVEATGSVLGSSVEDFGLGANGLHVARGVLASGVSLARCATSATSHFFLLE
jgi:hypothetical protein